ncbi:MAG TPA: NADH-quinone oxidoreductase subunit A [Symbiobacteriaceae bacterium]|nr:NADH-quinone oxidoreductase subunit A [Symbiobacteriaceae bacterium]
MYSYVDIIALSIVAIGFVLSNYLVIWLIAPKNPLQGEKLETYECGELPFDDALVNFNIRYYVFALTFFVFDMEAIYLYPWAVVFNGLGLFGLIEMLTFLAVLGIGLLYAIKKGVLHWV